MYKGITNSPTTAIIGDINASIDTITIADGSALPNAPNIATIALTEQAETILYVGKTGNVLTGVTRGFRGAAQSWPDGTPIARVFTDYDQEAYTDNIYDLMASNVIQPSAVMYFDGNVFREDKPTADKTVTVTLNRTDPASAYFTYNISTPMPISVLSTYNLYLFLQGLSTDNTSYRIDTFYFHTDDTPPYVNRTLISTGTYSFKADIATPLLQIPMPNNVLTINKTWDAGKLVIEVRFTKSSQTNQSIGIVSGPGKLAAYVRNGGSVLAKDVYDTLSDGSVTNQRDLNQRASVDEAVEGINQKKLVTPFTALKEFLQWIIDQPIGTLGNLYNSQLTGNDSVSNALGKAQGQLNSIFLIENRVYQGEDLSIKHASEINVSPYNGDVWKWIQARIKLANWSGIFVGDYIQFACTNGYNIKAEISGIDTYYRYGNTQTPHHIDFISRDCWPDAHQFNRSDYNNGTSVSPSPWLASDLFAWLNSLSSNVPNAATANPTLLPVNYATTGVYDKLPSELRNVIVSKQVLLPTRYTDGAVLNDDNFYAWLSAGKLWIPSEIELIGREIWGSKNGLSDMGFQQYPLFCSNMKRIKGLSDGGSRSPWWILSARGSTSTHYGYIAAGGFIDTAPATSGSIRVPVCFRIS